MVVNGGIDRSESRSAGCDPAMQVPASGSGRVRVGEFEVDLRGGELRRGSEKIKLQERPFQILAVLLQRPGEVVTREQLQQELWPANTFVDFEHSINTAVKKLREALGDDSENPRFIETLPRRGYRLIAAVEFVAPVAIVQGKGARAQVKAPPVEVIAPVEVVKEKGAHAEVGAPLVPPPLELPEEARRQKRWLVTAVAGGIVMLLAMLVGLKVTGLRDRLVGYAGAKSHASLQAVHIESIAVLPLENLSHDPEQEYFADGLTDALITDLGQVAPLRVISRTSVVQYKGAKKRLPQIAQELDVDAVVEGTVQRSGNQVRITAQLVEARTDTHLWAQTYVRDLGQLIQLEEQTALAIAHEVSGRLTTDVETRLASKRPVNPRAYDSYLHGRYLWNERTAETAIGARVYFEQALREDPGFALAYSGLADYYAVSWSIKQDEPLAETYARKAVALEPELAEAHASLGVALVYQNKFADGGKELKRAMELNPNYAMAHHWSSLLLLSLGRLSEALAENDRARRLDPFSLPINFLRGVMLLSLHEYDQAIMQLEKASAINSQPTDPHDQLARIYWIEGKVPDALAEERKVAILAHIPAHFHDQEEIAGAYGKSGLRAAQLKAAQLKERSYEPYGVLSVAFQYGLLKDRDKVLYCLKQTGWDISPYGKSAPEFDFLRSDPRFQDLLRRMNLPP